MAVIAIAPGSGCAPESSATDDAGLHPGTADAGLTPTGDGGTVGPSDDGTPMRRSCTSSFGAALSSTFGRLDGYLVAVVPIGAHGCNGDSTHVHLQILMKGATYDAAVNADGNFDEADVAMPDGTWTEGWHTGVKLDYPALAVHSGSFQSLGLAATGKKIESELAQANHVSVFMTGYGPDGGHLVHREGSGHDGAIVIRPLSGTAHLLFFDFSTSGSF